MAELVGNPKDRFSCDEAQICATVLLNHNDDVLLDDKSTTQEYKSRAFESSKMIFF